MDLDNIWLGQKKSPLEDEMKARQKLKWKTWKWEKMKIIFDYLWDEHGEMHYSEIYVPTCLPTKRRNLSRYETGKKKDIGR